MCRMFQQSLTLRRVKQLREEPYSQKEAEAAIGLTTDNGKRTAAPMDIDETAA
jgi:bud site selection protein 20